MFFNTVEIPKGNNGSRLIYVPDSEFLELLRSHLPYLEKRFFELDVNRVNYGFTKGKNCVLNALQHVGYGYTASYDLLDFFDSVTEMHLSKHIQKEVLNDCLVDGAPRQGLPTSPLLANIAFTNADRKIIDGLKQLGVDGKYTRYADDLSISFNRREDYGKITFLVDSIVRHNGFLLNQKKTFLQSAKNGRVVITGVAIDENGVHPTRKSMKKLRAALHQRRLGSARGLNEWVKCKLPKTFLE